MSDRPIRVRLTKTLGPNQHPECGLFTVPPDEAITITRGIVTQVARERLGDADGTASDTEVLDEATAVLKEIEGELERRFDTE
ncbi:hypothetical protein [Natronomonas salsuginis]|uniref:Uncharacterized protein n=1 Tax=Natronomonas salsuginis TaxID=2217661 RepID=A0A4U5JC31_9EURY|nr:hypothetical protein [Natronomonas salsuginis]TKR25841.1 hypothetical protein DM868_04880 [Natronomonas salsuginis]